MDVLETIGSLPKKIGDVTTSISTGAVSLDTMVGKMDAAIKGVPTYNPVSGAIVCGLSKTTGALKKGTSAISNAGKKIQTVGAGVSTALQPIGVAAQTIKQSLQDLQNCQEIVASSALVVNAVVDSCSGHFHPRINEQVLNKFDGQWDSWAKTINGIYQQLSPTGQANILESLAKGGFGDKVFYLGSAIKNESAGIFGGIADFEDALHAFEGSYRNPIVAAKKIETGVKNIMNATERVANSINNMVKIYQKGMGQNVSGNPILSYIGNLHNTKAVSAINKALTAVGGTATLLSDASSLQNALKDKDPRAIYSAGKKTIDDAKTIIKDLKDADKARKVTSLAKGALTGGAAPVNQTAAHQQTPQKDSQDGSGNTDSYVCSGAKMKCSFGDKIAQLTVYPDRTVFLTGQPMANISDHTSLYNIAPFGKCHTTSFPPTGAATAAAHGKLTPMPCVPGTNSNWMNGKNDYIIKGDPALLKSSFCRCCYGGVITITDDGQRDTGSADLSRALLLPKEQLNSNAEEKSKLDVDSVLDGIQTALDFAGFIPGAGAIPDLLNAAIYAARGDMANAGMSVLAAVPGIGDAAAGAKIAVKGVKASKAAKKAGKLGDAAKDNVTSISKFKADKVQKAIDESDNVTCFPNNKVSDTSLSKTKEVQKQDNVLHMDRYEKKVEKQVNGPDKVNVTKKTDTVVDSIGDTSKVPNLNSTSNQFFQNHNPGGGNTSGNTGNRSTSSQQPLSQLERRKKKTEERYNNAKNTLAKYPDDALGKDAVKRLEKELQDIEMEIRKQKYGF